MLSDNPGLGHAIYEIRETVGSTDTAMLSPGSTNSRLHAVPSWEKITSAGTGELDTRLGLEHQNSWSTSYGTLQSSPTALASNLQDSRLRAEVQQMFSETRADIRTLSNQVSALTRAFTSVLSEDDGLRVFPSVPLSSSAIVIERGNANFADFLNMVADERYPCDADSIEAIRQALADLDAQVRAAAGRALAASAPVDIARASLQAAIANEKNRIARAILKGALRAVTE